MILLGWTANRLGRYGATGEDGSDGIDGAVVIKSIGGGNVGEDGLFLVDMVE